MVPIHPPAKASGVLGTGLVTDLFHVDYKQTIVIGGILLICVYGLKALTEEDKIR